MYPEQNAAPAESATVTPLYKALPPNQTLFT